MDNVFKTLNDNLCILCLQDTQIQKHEHEILTDANKSCKQHNLWSNKHTI